MNTASRLLIALFALIPLVSAGGSLRANKKNRDLTCNCNPFNFQYDVDCCGPACDEPTSQFYDEEKCSCDPCNKNAGCYDVSHCCDACNPESHCYSETECCDECDPRSYCFDFYATSCSGGGASIAKATTGVLQTNSAPLRTSTAGSPTPAPTELPTFVVNVKKSSKKSGSSGSSLKLNAQNDETIYDASEDYEAVPERPLYIASIEAVTGNRLGSRAETIGSIYPFGKPAYNASDANDGTVEVKFTGGALDGNSTEIEVLHEGYCIRTGVNSTVAGYCHWQYSIEDIGTFLATGPIGDPSVESTLAIEGGTGILMGATGYVKVYGVVTNSAGFPANAPKGADPFSDVTGYYHDIQLIIDEYFRTQTVTTATNSSSS